MRNPNGYAIWRDLDSDRSVEMDSAQCCHCQRHMFVKPGTMATVYMIADMSVPGGWREEAGAACRICMKPVCLACEALGTCTPFERKMEQLEARDRLARQALGVK